MRCIGAWLVCLHFASSPDERGFEVSPLYHLVLKEYTQTHTDVHAFELMYKEAAQTRFALIFVGKCELSSQKTL